MADVVVAHPSLNRGGGAEKVCLSLIRALASAGYKVKLATLDKTDWKTLEKRFGKLIRPASETCLTDNISSFGMLPQLAAVACLFPLMLLHLRRKERGIIVNTYGDLIDYYADIAYVNAIPIKLSHKIGSGLPQSLMWKAGINIYNKFSVGPSYKSLLISNSKFIQNILLKNMGRSSIIIHPPVEVDIFIKGARHAKKRENLVVSVSRLRPGKRLNIVPKIASLVREAEFIILGVADNASKSTLKEINDLTRRLKVDDRVKLLLNLKFEDYVNMLASASIYLHTQPSEAFGMSIVEAMAAGCIPLVPRSGGPWIDILDCSNGLYGFSYNSEAEAAKLINMIVNDRSIREKIKERAVKRSLNFSKTIFNKKILGIINKFHEKSLKTP